MCGDKGERGEREGGVTQLTTTTTSSMQCQGAMLNAAAVTACLLALMGLGLSASAEDCGHCFYRQMLPGGTSSSGVLRWHCHRSPGGQAFATLHRPTCDMAAVSAFHLGHVGTGGEEPAAVVVTEDEDVHVLTPALLRGEEDQTPDDSPLELWDSSITSLVRSSVGPRCSSLPGDLYVLTGRGLLGPEVGCEEASPLFWSAMCCDVPSEVGEKGFAVALVREAQGGEEEKEVSVERLEELLGVTALFSGGCGGGLGEAAMVGGLPTGVSVENVEPLEDHLGTALHSAGEEITEQEAKRSAENQGQTPDDPAAQQEAKRSSGAPAKASAAADDDGGPTEQRTSEAKLGHSSEAADETAETEPEEVEGNSTIIYLISTSVYILTLPLRPVVSTITSIPGQVAYVLQEDLCVLAGLPGDTCYVFYLVTCGTLSWIRSAVELVVDLVWVCICGVYHCTWAMLAELLGSCYAGLAGVGTLACDSLGIAGDALDNAWWVTRLLGRRLWENSEGYVGSVASEMGGQVMSVGGGLGTLVWRCLKGVGHVITFMLSIVLGTVRMIALGILDPSTTQDNPPVLVIPLINAE